MKRYIVLVLAAVLFYTYSFGQVKEVNFFGKSWYLHGIDARLIFPNYKTTSSTHGIARNHSQLFHALGAKYDYSVERIPRVLDMGRGSDFGLSAGLVLKPFSRSTVPVLQSLEAIHNIGIRREKYYYYWSDISPIGSDFGAAEGTYLNSMFFYHPSVNISTRSVAKRLKFYAGLDLRFATSNKVQYDLIYYAKDYFFLNTNTEPSQPLNLNIGRRSIGGGGTIGVKLAPTCYFNVHCELKSLYSTSWYTSTKTNFGQSTLQLNFGFRYKFAGPIPETDEDQEKQTDQVLFW